MDAQSTLVISASGLALGNQNVADTTFTGNVTHFDGTTTASGTGTVKIKGSDESRVDLTLSSSARSEVRAVQAGIPAGSWSNGSQVSKRQALHNLLIPACWASPVLLIASVHRPGTTVVYVAQEQRSGSLVDHLRVSYLPAGISFRGSETSAVVQRLSTYDLYFDALTHLPLALAFTAHSDRDLNVDIPAEVQFSNYTNVSGVLVPFHVQRLIQKRVNLDFTVSTAAVNVGLTDSDFAVQ
jgi:hypothetical protein